MALGKAKVIHNDVKWSSFLPVSSKEPLPKKKKNNLNMVPMSTGCWYCIAYIKISVFHALQHLCICHKVRW